LVFALWDASKYSNLSMRVMSKTWHGVDRTLYVWYPRIDYDKCTGCGLCLLTCGNDVFRWSREKNLPVVANPGSCVMGCTTCAKLCPEDAISFPDDPKKFLKSVVMKEKVFFTVKKELRDRLDKYPDHRVSIEDVEAWQKAKSGGGDD